MTNSCAKSGRAAINQRMVTDTPTDTDLLRRYIHDGSEMAFTEFVQRHLGLVYRVALRKSGGNRSLAEDVAQRVFTLVARKAATLTQHQTLIGWLHQTAVFTASEILRTERRRIAREQEAFTMDQIDRENSSDNESLKWSSIGPVIDEVLTELGEQDREIVLLRYFADLPHAQVGRQLALSDNAARMRAERALEKLRMILARRGVTSTTAALGLTLSTQVSASTVAIPATLASSISISALAAAASVTATAAAKVGIVTLMTTAKSTLWIAGTLAIVSLSFTGYTAFHQHLAESRLVAETNHEQELKKAALALQTRLEKINGDLSKRSRASSAPPKTSAVIAKASALEVDLARIREQVEARQKQLASNPEYQRKWNAATIAWLNLDYQPFYRTTAMPAERISKFEEILMRKTWGVNDLRAAAKTLNLSEEDPAIKAEAARQESTFDAEFKAVLSPDEFAELKQFDLTSMTRRLVGEVAANTYYTPTPLTKAQGDELKQLIEAHDPHLATARPAWRQDGIDWETILKQGDSILTPEQLKVLKTVAARSRWIGEQIRVGNGWSKL